MKFSDFATEHGGYIDKDGCSYDDKEELLQAGILEMCCCGNPELNLWYVMRGLEVVESRRDYTPEGYAKSRALADEVFKSTESENFFYYWTAARDYTEHGGSIPGWLTEKGRDLLEMLREWWAERERDRAQ